MNVKIASRTMLLFTAIILTTMAACAPATAPEPTPTLPPQPSATPPPPPPETEAPTEAPVPPPSPVSEPALPPEPQTIEFSTSDGQSLNGTYYPGATNPAPLIVLMHWAPGDQQNWPAIAFWLQNRGAGEDPGGAPWLDSSWFPPMPEGASYAVFAFTFRGCEGGCSAFQPDGWLLDAQAAVRTAQELPGVDPNRVVTLGASIGADGASDACGEGCLGSFSLSPGSYLTIPYDEAVTVLDTAGKPAWCLASEGDAESHPTCQSASGGQYRTVSYPGSGHGMDLVRPESDPNPLDLFLEFLQLVMGS